MAERQVKMTLPDGRVVDGVDVQVDESNERWSEFTLTDGTVIRLKVTLVGAVRAVGDYDPEGKPWYTVNMMPVISVTRIPDRLMKKS